MNKLSSTVALMVTLSSTETTPLGPDQVLITELGSNSKVPISRHITSWGLPRVLLTDGTAEILEIIPEE